MGLKHYPKGFKVWDQAPNINLSPSEIQRMYERGYSGVYFDPEAYEEFKELSVRTGGYLNVEDAASRYGWYGNFAGQLVIPFVHIMELCPGAIPGPSQLSGSCVAHAGKNAVLGTMVCEVVSGLPDEVTGAPETLPEVSSTAMKNGYLAIEPAYWYRGHGGEGWQCSQHASVSIKNSGAMLRKNYPEIGIDLTVYTRANTHKWGRTPPPESVGKHLKNNLIRSVAKVNSFEGFRDSLGNGKFINTCGMEGFSSKRDEYGVSSRQGQWAHALGAYAADDRPEIVRKYGSPLVLIQNSWGPGWNSGPRDIFDSAKYVPAAKKDLWIRLGIVSSTTGNILIPQGSFWAKWSDISRRDSYVYAGVHGWKASPITTWGTELIG